MESDLISGYLHVYMQGKQHTLNLPNPIPTLQHYPQSRVSFSNCTGHPRSSYDSCIILAVWMLINWVDCPLTLFLQNSLGVPSHLDHKCMVIVIIELLPHCHTLYWFQAFVFVLCCFSILILSLLFMNRYMCCDKNVLWLCSLDFCVMIVIIILSPRELSSLHDAMTLPCLPCKKWHNYILYPKLMLSDDWAGEISSDNWSQKL